MQTSLSESPCDADETWCQIAPLLDTAIADLGEKDRHAIVLRFFENKSLSEVGQALGANEDAARMRVNRALEKLRRMFTKRGVVSTVAIIAGAISANSVQAAPVALAASVSAVGVAKGAAASSSTLILIKGALKIMAWTKAKMAIVAGAAILLVAGTVTVVVEQNMSDRNEPVYQGKTVTAWIKQMYSNPNDMTAHYALIGLGDPAIPYLMRELEIKGAGSNSRASLAESARRRSQVFDVLGGYGSRAKVAIPALIDSLGDKDSQILRFSGVVALGNIGSAASNAVPALVQALNDDDFNVRMETALALAKIGQPTPEAVSGLAVLLEEKRAAVRLQASLALWRLQPDDGDAARRVRGLLLQDADASIRRWTALLLGDPALAATNFVPSLEAALHDSDASVREAASSSLKKLKALQP